MNTNLVELFFSALKGITDLCKKAIDSGDPQKYTQSINELNKNIDDTYGKMRDIIANSKEFTDAEKLEKLSVLADKEMESKAKCQEALDGNRKNVGKIALDVFEGFLTCGLSYAPRIIKQIRKSLSDDELVIIDEIDSLKQIEQ